MYLYQSLFTVYFNILVVIVSTYNCYLSVFDLK